MRNERVKKFFQKLGMIGAGAAVFGLVAGGTFAGVTKLTSEPQQIVRETAALSDTEEEKEEEEGGTKLLTTTVNPGTAATAADSNIAAVAADVMPSIVAITAVSEEEYMNFFGQRTGQTYESQAAGSGIIVGSDAEYLYIATNNHVVTGSTALTVQFLDESTAPAEIRDTDSKNDLAVVQIKLSDLEEGTMDNIKVAVIGDSDSLQVGETAIAIGNALGYGQSVTTGIISALNRNVDSQDATTGERVVTTLIQTDAAINPGNSGGALLNSKGEVIGINSSKYADTTVEGMGFAIPINTAKEIIQAIIDGTLEEHQAHAGYLGISGLDISEEDASKYGMPQGVYIAKIAEGSAAEKAGLRKGQIITKIDDKTIASASQLAQVITSYQGGDTVTVTVATADNGSYVKEEVQVTLGMQSEKVTETAKGEDGTDPAQRGEGGPGEAPEGQETPFENGQEGSGEDGTYGGYQQQIPGDGGQQYYFGDFGDLGDLFEQFMR